MAKDSEYTILLGAPGPTFGWNTVKAMLALTKSKHTVQFENSGNAWDDFDHIWTLALNASEAGQITHFAMIHSDVAPILYANQPVWLDILVEELDRLGLDMVSAIIPLKDFSGITSSGIGDPENRWSPYRRLTVRELESVPDTFNAKDLGFDGMPLLHNTGCWVCDMRSPVFHQTDSEGTFRAFFAFPQRVYRDEFTGKAAMARESEDWYFSRCLYDLGAKTAVTKKVRLIHEGKAHWKNWGNWGISEHDDATAHRWAVPRGPWDKIHGWFDFADLYQEQVNVASDGARFVEVGSWLGKSAVFMGDAIRRSGKRIRFDCVDNWVGGDSFQDNGVATKAEVEKLDEDIFDGFRRNIAANGLGEIVNAIRKPSAEAAEDYADESLDFVFLDADHAEEAVRADLANWWPKVKPGGILAGHDYNEAGPKAAVEKWTAGTGLDVVKRLRSFVIRKPDYSGNGRAAKPAASPHRLESPDPILGNTAEYQWV